MVKWILKIVCLFGMIQCNSTSGEKELLVEKVQIHQELSFSEVSFVLEQHTKLQQIDVVGWKEFSYKPKVQFRLAHSDSLLFIKFYVDENHLLARQQEPNSATHTDSCVEFFFDPLGNGNYYNFEFNCIGTTHLAYGPNRRQRNFVSKKEITDQIQIWTTLGKAPFEERTGNFHWEMVVAIPNTILVYTPNFTFSNKSARANFYKCGDHTSKPHYLSWNEVLTPRPDFHQPEYFGTFIFK